MDDDIDSLLEQGIMQAELRAQKEQEEEAAQTTTMSYSETTMNAPRKMQDGEDNSNLDLASTTAPPTRPMGREDRPPRNTSRSRSPGASRKHSSSSHSHRREDNTLEKKKKDHTPRHSGDEEEKGGTGGGSEAGSVSPRASKSSSRRRSRSGDRSSRRRHRREHRSSSRRSHSRSVEKKTSSRASRKPKRDSSRRSRSRSRSHSYSSDGSSKSPPRARSTSAERLARAKKKEMMELTRDHRTIFVTQLQIKVKEKKIMKFFTQLGGVENVHLIRDKFTNRSKGIAYVEMSELEDVPKALLMNGQVPDFQVFPIMVKASEAEKNFARKKEDQMTSSSRYASMSSLSSSSSSVIPPFAASAGTSCRIYVGNLHTNITEGDLATVFASFGEVVTVNINRDDMNRSKGFAFIQFRTEAEAAFAISKGNGLELAGNALKLGPVAEHTVTSTGAVVHEHADSWKLDDDDGSGMQMNSQSRAALMAKLAGASAGSDFTASNVAPSLPLAQALMPPPMTGTTNGTSGDHSTSDALKLVPIEGVASTTFVLKNMFDVSQEVGEHWHTEIQQDVASECSKHGAIVHVSVDRSTTGGLVYVALSSQKAAAACVNDMHGRWFNKKQITVRFLSSHEYVGMFPSTRSEVLATARA